MTNIELKALRQICFLTQAECAEHIGGASRRAWTHWENGAREVPHDVERGMNLLIKRRLAELEFVKRKVVPKPIPWHETFESFQAARGKDKSHLDWRIAQSVAAQCVAEGLSKLDCGGGASKPISRQNYAKTPDEVKAALIQRGKI